MLLEIPLTGPVGEPVDLWRTLVSHGVADLPPMRVNEEERTLTATLPLAGAKPRTVILRASRREALVDVLGPKLGTRAEAGLRRTLRRVLNLEEDLSGFYELAAADPDLAWAAQGAGRMLRSPTVFEEVIKTRCTFITALPLAWVARPSAADFPGAGAPAAHQSQEETSHSSRASRRRE